MKYLAWAICAINFYLGIYYMLNALNILRSGKYARSSNFVFSIILLTMTAAAVYFLLRPNHRDLAFWVSLGPWAIILVVLLFSMLFSKYQ